MATPMFSIAGLLCEYYFNLSNFCHSFEKNISITHSTHSASCMDTYLFCSFQTVTNISCFQILPHKDFWTVIMNWWSSNKDHLNSGTTACFSSWLYCASCKACVCPVSSLQQVMTHSSESSSPFEEPLETIHKPQASNGNLRQNKVKATYWIVMEQSSTTFLRTYITGKQNYC